MDTIAAIQSLSTPSSAEDAYWSIASTLSSANKPRTEFILNEAKDTRTERSTNERNNSHQTKIAKMFGPELNTMRKDSHFTGTPDQLATLKATLVLDA
jgi:hypothetical protein